MIRTIGYRVYGDFLMPSGLGAYRNLLESALGAGYEPITVERFWKLIADDAVDPARRYLILRHDIDTDPRTGAEMWEIERSLGIVGSYYFRLSTLDLDLMAAIAADGGEVGYHYEELATVAKEQHLRDRESVLRRLPEAQGRFQRNIDKLRGMTGLPLRVVASHGDFVNRRVGLPNWAMLADQRIRRLADIDLEVYDDAFVSRVSRRHSDTEYPRRWTFGDVSRSLEAGMPSVYVLVHPRNWQARPAENARDDLRRLKEGALFGLPISPVSTSFRGRRLKLGSRRSPAVASVPTGAIVIDPAEPIAATKEKASDPGPQGPQQSGPVLLVRASANHAAERRYVIDLVLTEWLGLDYQLSLGDETGVSIRLAGDERGGVLTVPDVLFATPDDDWLTERSLAEPPLARMSIETSALASPDSTGVSVAESQPVPVLFAVPGAGTELFTTTSNGISFAADIFGSVFYQVTRYEEVARPYVDEHGRYPSYVSLARIEDFVERPIVDEYVDALWVAIHELWPTLSRRRTEFRLRLTHDVDQPWAALGQPVGAVLHSLAGDLIRRRDLPLAARRVGSFALAQTGRLNGDPYDTFDLLMDTSERHGLRSTFYFLAGNTAGAIDGRYELSDPPIRRLLKKIHDRGHEVGLHASYGTYQVADLIVREADALRRACAAIGFEQEQWGVRQHYLRLAIPTTWRAHELAGLDHDSTLGFADHIGFRAGTCREFPIYDLRARREMRLRERPIAVMDATLFGYQSLDPDRGASRARAVIDACRRHRGDAVLLYHNNSLGGTRLGTHYQNLIEDLVHPS